MRKFLALAALLAVCSVCEAKGRFVEFPAVGMCTGDYVRYRAQPNTKAEIWGRLHTGERVIVEGMTSVNGETWYEIFPPNAQDTAYINGKYMTPLYDEETQRSPAGKLIVDVLQEYACNEDYDYYEEYGGPEVRRNYSGGWLVRVEAWKPECNFGDIEIGDKVSKLTRILGEPDAFTKSQYTYLVRGQVLGEQVMFTFKIQDGKISRMIYEENWY